jgi:hypothetical protein
LIFDAIEVFAQNQGPRLVGRSCGFPDWRPSENTWLAKSQNHIGKIKQRNLESWLLARAEMSVLIIVG